MITTSSFLIALPILLTGLSVLAAPLASQDLEIRSPTPASLSDTSISHQHGWEVIREIRPSPTPDYCPWRKDRRRCIGSRGIEDLEEQGNWNWFFLWNESIGGNIKREKLLIRVTGVSATE